MKPLPYFVPYPTLLLLYFTPSLVLGKSLVSVHVHTYKNDDNTRKDGVYCRDDEGPCNTELYFKIEQPPLSYQFTLAALQTDYIEFGTELTPKEPTSDSDRIPNPFPGSDEERTVTKGIGLIFVVVDAWMLPEIADANKERIATFRIIRYLASVESWGTQNHLVDSAACHLNITTTVECAPDYYLNHSPDNTDIAVSNCTYCVETPAYTCNQEDGSKICKTGRSGPDCDIQFCPMIKSNKSITITPSSYQTDSLEVGYTLTFSCPGPYLSYLSTTPYMTCLDTGHWNSTVPYCMPVVDGIDKKIKSLWVSGVAILSGVLVTSVSTALVMDYLTSKLAGQHQVPIKTTPDVTDKTKLIVPSNDKSVVNCQPYTKHLKVGLNTFPNPIEDCDF